MATFIENASIMSNTTINTVKAEVTQTEIVLIFFSGLTAFLHMVGIVLLWFMKSELNQILTLINLAVAEMILCLNVATLSIFKAWQILYMSFTIFSFLAIRMFMLILVDDRFSEVYKYQIPSDYHQRESFKIKHSHMDY